MMSDSATEQPAAHDDAQHALRDWTDPALLPELPDPPQWGLFKDGAMQPMPLPELVALIQGGRGAEQLNGKGERPDVVFVTRPESTRPVPAVECPELRAAILKRDEDQLVKTRRTNGLFFYPLLLVTIFLELTLSTLALLPAVFAMTNGAAHAEAWRTLARLRADPDRYLRDTSAQIRYAAWLTLAGNRYWSRTWGLVLIWVAIYAVQYFLPAGARGEPAPYLAAAALVKSAVVAEPWRLLTAAMLHGSILHILMNAITMLSLGVLMERGAHRHLLVPVWLAGALAGSLLSWAGTPATSVGASGGIMAVFSFLLVMGYRCRARLPPDFSSSLVRGLVMIGMLGLLAWGVIDNAAHLGGVLAGAAIARWVFRGDHTTLPLSDSPALTAVSRGCWVIVVAVAVFTLMKLLLA